MHHSLLWSKTRLHGHAIFGVVSVSDTCRIPERVRLAGFRCPASVLFFFFFFFVSPTRADTAPTQLRRFRHASNEEEKENFSIFRVIPANFSRNENFIRYKILTGKKKKIKIKILPPPSGFRAFLPPHLLLNFGLFFFFFFFFFWFRSAT